MKIEVKRCFVEVDNHDQFESDAFWTGDLPRIKRARPPSASDDIFGDASIVPTIARVRADVGDGGGNLRWRERSQATASKQKKANTANK